MNWKEIIINNRIFLVIIFVYFFINLLNLTLLPIFNDEAIYLDWAWVYTHNPGHLFDSLLDAKQPLMIWIFAFFENFFNDPLFAGRFTSVLIGAITVLGIYVTAKRLLNKQAALIAALLYIIIPIFVFYNRQALMESAIACIGIWSAYALLNLINLPSIKHGLILGIILGIGFLIKSSSLMFAASSTLIILYYILKKRKTELIKPYLFSVVFFFCVNLILFIQPQFLRIISTNNNYIYSLKEILTLPFSSWINNLLAFIEIGFMFITPFVFTYGVFGFILLFKAKSKSNKIFLMYFLLAIILIILSGKYLNQRYIVSFLPFLLIPASYVFNIFWNGNILRKSIVVVSFLIPFILSLGLIFNPEYYIIWFSKISGYSDLGYVRGQTSGYGIKEVMRYIKEHSIPSQPNLVFIGLNSGNPENAIDLYSQKDPQLYSLHIDSKFFPGIESYDCIISRHPTFFITRENQLKGMDRFFTLEKSFLNHDRKYFVGIYRLKKDCSGNTISLPDYYQWQINKILESRIKSDL